MAAKQKSRRRSNQESTESTPATELLVLELQQIHSAESQLARALPRLSRAAQSDKLRQMLERRQEEGGRIIEGIEASFAEIDESLGKRKNVAAEGLINDAREQMQDLEEGPALDAALIASMQKTEHYCIAAWGTARTYAQATEQTTVVKTMERALKEGKTLDERLTQLSEREVLPELLSQESGSESMPQRGTQGRRRRSSRSGREAGA